MAYASRTGTRRNLAALRAKGWGLIVSAAGVHRAEGFERYAIDNGAWSAYQRGAAWDERPFLALLDSLGRGADFVVAPDIVAGGVASLRLSESWLRRIDGYGRKRLIAVQDGMSVDDVRPLLCREVGVFVGGSTNWKLRTLSAWAALARERGAHCHVGRVNTVRRIRLCLVAGVDSFDGSSATRFAVNLTRLNNARNQTAWVF